MNHHLSQEVKMSKKTLALWGFVVITFIFTATSALAQPHPIQVALVTPVQIFPEDDQISGLRLNLLYGRNSTVTGLDMGFVNHTTAGLSKGVQLGFLNMTETDFMGWQHGWANVTQGDFEGFQWGFFNYAKFANGLQLGFVNYAESMKGLQIGLVNIIKQGGAFPVFPIVNWTFD
jgi:energy-coupling factor transporter transmembrane protein EcfT